MADVITISEVRRAVYRRMPELTDGGPGRERAVEAIVTVVEAYAQQQVDRAIQAANAASQARVRHNGPARNAAKPRRKP